MIPMASSLAVDRSAPAIRPFAPPKGPESRDRSFIILSHVISCDDYSAPGLEHGFWTSSAIASGNRFATTAGFRLGEAIGRQAIKELLDSPP
jgi:hypothetical protein